LRRTFPENKQKIQNLARNYRTGCYVSGLALTTMPRKTSTLPQDENYKLETTALNFLMPQSLPRG